MVKFYLLFGNFVQEFEVSRVGKKSITIPDKVNLTVDGKTIKAKGPKGELAFTVPDGIEFNIENKTLTFSRISDDKKIRALHGLSRALTNNIIEGVLNGFTKTLQIEGVGYKAEMKGNNLMLSLGFSHPLLVIPPAGVKISSPNPNTILLDGIDKQLVGEVAAKIRKLRPPEPYKGKGIRYSNEYIRRKAGKTTSK